jgi:acyl transferase domain-containing protein
MPAADPARDPVAITGIGLALPGGVESLDTLTQALDARRCTLQPQPWARGAAGFASCLAPRPFDHTLFRMPLREVDTLDPQQALLMECTWHALEDAGLPISATRGSRVGVFVALSGTDNPAALARAGRRDVFLCTGNSHAAAAGRLSYLFGWRGPCLAVDTACSASLTALHLAWRSLQAGECDAALVASANLIRLVDYSEVLASARMLSPSGRVRAFSAEADGYVRGEGGVAVWLEREPAARAAGRRVQARVRGSAINQDGASASLTAPNAAAQRDVMRDALAAAGIAPADVDALEAHGTGTPLGDPIELTSIAQVYGAGRARALPVGSAKNNFGHLEATAGLLSVAKALAQFRARRLLPTPGAEPLTTQVDWSALNLCVAGVDAPTDTVPRCIAVSAFSFAGSNAHLLLDAPPPLEAPARPAGADAGGVLLLSAQTPAALQALVQAHRDALRAVPDAQVADWCRAVAVSREPLRHRVAWAFDDAAALRQALDAPPPAAADARARRGQTVSAAALRAAAAGPREAHDAWRDAFLAGDTLDWSGAVDAAAPDLVAALPRYPFDRGGAVPSGAVWPPPDAA